MEDKGFLDGAKEARADIRRHVQTADISSVNSSNQVNNNQIVSSNKIGQGISDSLFLEHKLYYSIDEIEPKHKKETKE